MRLFYYVPLAVFLFLANATFAQDAPRFNIGLRAGVGLAGSAQLDRIDRETTDQYKRGLALSGGLGLRYQLHPNVALTLGAEVQRMQDRRENVWTPVFRAENTFTNRLTRVQVPVGLQLRPLSKLKSIYVSAGAGPVFLLRGSTEYEGRNLATGGTWRSNVTYPLNIPQNRHYRTDWVFVGGLGVNISKRLAIELTYQHAKELDLTTFDPGATFINPPSYTTRAGQGWLLTTTYWIK